MKIIAVLIGITVVILVILGYDLLIKLAEKKNKQIIKDLDRLVDDHYVEKQEFLNLKDKINESNKSNSQESKTKTRKPKTNGKQKIND